MATYTISSSKIETKAGEKSASLTLTERENSIVLVLQCISVCKCVFGKLNIILGNICC